MKQLCDRCGKVQEQTTMSLIRIDRIESVTQLGTRLCLRVVCEDCMREIWRITINDN